MTATERRAEVTVTPGDLCLNTEVFDALAAKHGANTNDKRAELINVDRATFFRWRSGKTAPNLAKAWRIAEQFGTTVDQLWRRIKAAA